MTALRTQWQAVLTGLCGLCMVVMFLAMIPGAPLGGPDSWGIAACVFGSVNALGAGYRSLKRRSLDVNVLMLLAAVGAIAIGHFDDAAVLLFLFALSSTMEDMAMAKTQSAIEALVKLQPEKAIRVTEQGDEEVGVELLRVGDQVRVKPFEPVPTDGTLLTDEASFDESAMTGESMPVPRLAGDSVMAGTQNLDRMILMRVTSESKSSTLDRVVNLVQEAQENKASGERISAWFGEKYTFGVLAAFGISFCVQYFALRRSPQEAFSNALILLVALSPCALVISSPAASLSALAFAARRGLLVRGGQILEDAGRITMVALDKTGTLTLGKPEVVEVCVLEESAVAVAVMDRPCEHGGCLDCWRKGTQELSAPVRDILTLAAAAEKASTHPIAEAIVAHTISLGLPVPEVNSQQVHAGLGVEAEIGGQKIRIGQKKFFESEMGSVPPEFAAQVDDMRHRGLTAVLIHTGHRWAAIGLRDQMRKEAPQFIAELRAAGVKRIAMLTGDNNVTGQAVGGELGLTEVHAQLMPEDKFRLVQEWSKEGERVMMVGDGVNDAPALTAATLGVAMGGLGSEAALRASDVVVIQDRLLRLPELLRLGKKTNSIIKGNLFFASGVIVALVIGSFFGVVPLALAVIGHEGSTAIVVLNGLRLLRGP